MFKKSPLAIKHGYTIHRPLLLLTELSDRRFVALPSPPAPISGGLLRQAMDWLLLSVAASLTAAVVVFCYSQQLGSSAGSIYLPAALQRIGLKRLSTTGLARGVVSLAASQSVQLDSTKAVVSTPVNPDIGCRARTVMNIVAHEDDDLLFINPEIIRNLRQHNCVRTVYMTAGDDGRGADYLRLRELGSEAAYDVMLGNKKPWEYHPLTMLDGTVVMTANPESNPNVSLIFLRLPDGNFDGSGFARTDNQSLLRLQTGELAKLMSVDGQANYDSAKLIDTLVMLMQRYSVRRINTQANDGGRDIADHSDHTATSDYVTAAAMGYAKLAHLKTAQIIHYYMGYPIRGMNSNLRPVDASLKSAAFFAYAIDDAGVCTSMLQCQDTKSTYGQYLSRQYTVVNR